jgi:nitroreductase
MDALDALLTRRSSPRLTTPAPNDEQLNLLISAALRAADHALLRPWRFLSISGEGLDKLGAEQLNLTILFISHDLPVVRQMCDRIGVLKDGQLCEVANTEEIFLKPQHDYTKKLLHLMPKIESIYN